MCIAHRRKNLQWRVHWCSPGTLFIYLFIIYLFKKIVDRTSGKNTNEHISSNYQKNWLGFVCIFIKQCTQLPHHRWMLGVYNCPKVHSNWLATLTTFKLRQACWTHAMSIVQPHRGGLVLFCVEQLFNQRCVKCQR